MTDNCPILILQPITMEPDTRTLSYNYDQIQEWTKRMCAYVDTLKARIAALEAGP